MCAYHENYIRDAQGNIMATYRYTNETSVGVSLLLNERPIYGSSRLGTYTKTMQLYNAQAITSNPPPSNIIQRPHLRYELTDHLGNVAAVITGRLLLSQSLAPFEADLVSAQGYEPFGSLLPGRNYSSDAYRFGFGGMPKDDEVHGNTGTSLDFGARMYDPRIARFIAIDPIAGSYPFMSPYVFAGNDPIRFTDDFGMGPGDRVKLAKQYVGTKYAQDKTTALRTGTDAAALATMDCSELVCRVLAADGVLPKIKHLNTGGLMSLMNDPAQFHRSDVPQVGDVFLWRGGDDGAHTGIVTGVNADGTVQITHAANSKRGLVVDDNLKTSYFTGKSGWQGFYRPVKETANQPVVEGTPPARPDRTNGLGSSGTGQSAEERAQRAEAFFDRVSWATGMIQDMQSRNSDGIFDDRIKEMEGVRQGFVNELNEFLSEPD